MLNIEQLRIFVDDWSVKEKSSTKLLACSILSLVIEKDSLTALRLSNRLISEIFINLKKVKITARRGMFYSSKRE